MNDEYCIHPKFHDGICVWVLQDVKLKIGPSDQWRMYEHTFPESHFGTGLTPWSGCPKKAKMKASRSTRSHMNSCDASRSWDSQHGIGHGDLSADVHYEGARCNLPGLFDSLCRWVWRPEIEHQLHHLPAHAPQRQPDFPQPDLHGLLAKTCRRRHGGTERRGSGRPYLNFHCVSHRTNRHQPDGRQVRSTSDFQGWRQIFPQVWQDFFDHGTDFEVILVTPEAPASTMRESSGTVLVIQHPDAHSAACLTTAWIPDVLDFSVIVIAHSFAIHSDQRHLLWHAGVLDLCDQRSALQYGVCKVRVGRFEYQLDSRVRIHDGLGLLIEVPPPTHPAD